MKTTLASFLIAILVATGAIAQDNPYLSSGRTFAGGGISLGFGGNGADNGDPTISQDVNRIFASLSPTGGRFYNDRWAVGMTLTGSYSRNRQLSTGTNSLDETLSRQVGVGIAPFLRRYFPLTERFGAYLQPEISYDYQLRSVFRERRDDFQFEANSRTEFINRQRVGSINLGGGLYYFVTNHFAVETNLLRFALSVRSGTVESKTVDNQVDMTTLRTETDAQLNFINQLSLNQVLVINYYF